MNYFIAYDITHNRLRRKTIQVLMRYGCVRVQKSVFIGTQVSPADIRALTKELEKLLEKGEDTDAVMCIPIERNLLQQAHLIGDKIPFKQAIAQPDIQFF